MSDFEPESTPGFPVPPPSDTAVMATLTQGAMDYLSQTQPWVRFISIVIFVSAGFMALGGCAMMAMVLAGAMTGRGIGRDLGVIGGFAAGSFYLMLACLYIAPGVFLHRYAVAIKQLKAACTPDALEDALKHQRSFWRFVGILSAVGLVVSLLILLFVVAAGVLGAVIMGRR
jgi:hypothetical protein